jgi:hypothetical protein
MIAENVAYVTSAIRGDVDRINATVASANERIQQAVAVTEHRLADFNALLHVVQEEAEDLFITTASTVRGVRAGAASFRSPGGPELASTPDTAAPPGAANELEQVEDSDGHDTNADRRPRLFDPDQSAPPAPRVRPGPRGRR